jgi:glycosyltransferase involved in cell wall biosynthesis
MSEISGDEHQRLLLNASVYALVLREINASAGQVRFARAIEAGIPVVASAVRGLDGYLVNEITGLAVPVGDATALRIAIDRLTKDATVSNSLRLRAYEEMRPRTLTTYISEIKRFCLSAKAGGLA